MMVTCLLFLCCKPLHLVYLLFVGICRVPHDCLALAVPVGALAAAALAAGWARVQVCQILQTDNCSFKFGLSSALPYH